MSHAPPAHAMTIGAAIRAARFSRGLTQDDLAVRLGVTRATIASYETGRRKVPAGTLIQIAHLCGKPLTFFDGSRLPAPGAQPHPAQADMQHAAIDAVVTTLHAHPEFTSFVLEFLETLIHDQVTGAVLE